MGTARPPLGLPPARLSRLRLVRLFLHCPTARQKCLVILPGYKVQYPPMYSLLFDLPSWWVTASISTIKCTSGSLLLRKVKPNLFSGNGCYARSPMRAPSSVSWPTRLQLPPSRSGVIEFPFPRRSPLLPPAYTSDSVPTAQHRFTG